MESIYERLSDFIFRYGDVQTDDHEVYDYGLRLFITSWLHNIIILLLGGFLGLVAETLVFLICTSMIRKYSGGYHAKTSVGCLLLSVSTTIVALLYCIIFSGSITTVFQYGIIISAGIIMMILSPQDYETKRLEEIEKAVYKKRALYSIGVLMIIGVVSVFKGNRIGRILPGALLIHCIMLIFSFVHNYLTDKK